MTQADLRPEPGRGGFLSDVAAAPAMIDGLFGEHRALVVERVRAAARLIAPGERVLFSAMGSSLSAAEAVLPRLRTAGRSAVAVDAGEMLHGGLPGLVRGIPVILISQSGRSAEIVRLLDRLAESGAGPVIAVTNDESSRLAAAAAVVLPIFAGPERAVATRTFTATVVVLHELVDALLDEELATAAALAAPVETMRELAGRPEHALEWADALGDAGSLVVVGRGPLLGIAQYAALTIKETTRVHAEAMAGGAFRHGPLEIAGAALGVIVLADGSATRDLQVRVAADIAVAGSPTWLLDVGAAPGSCTTPPGVSIHTCLGELSMIGGQLVASTAVQLFAAALARRRGLEPGVMVRSAKVTETE